MPKEKEIKDVTAFLMISLAIFYDVLQIVIGWIPVLGNVLAMGVSFYAYLSFLCWFWIYGIKMTTPKRLLSMLATLGIELIPYVDMIPGWFFVVVYLIGTTKVKEFASKHSVIAGKVVSIGEKIVSKKPGNVIPDELDKAA